MAKEPVPQEVVEMLSFLTTHKIKLASFFGLKIDPSSRDRKINRILEYPGDHMILHDTVMGVPCAFLSVCCSRPTFENVTAFLEQDAPSKTFDFINPKQGIWKTEVKLGMKGVPVVSFVITNVQNVMPLDDLAAIPATTAKDGNVTIVEAAEVTLNRVKKRMGAVLALLEEFLPDEPIITLDGTFTKKGFIDSLRNDTFAYAEGLWISNLQNTVRSPEYTGEVKVPDEWREGNATMDKPFMMLPGGKITDESLIPKESYFPPKEGNHTIRREGDKIIIEGTIIIPNDEHQLDFFSRIFLKDLPDQS